MHLSRTPIESWLLRFFQTLCWHWQTQRSLWCQFLASRNKNCSLNIRSTRNSSLDFINILTTCDILSFLLFKNTDFPNRAFHILIRCTAGFRGRSMVEFFYGDDHSTHSLNFWLMTMRKTHRLNITTSNAIILVLVQYQSDDNVDEYQFILSKIPAINDSFESSNILSLVTSTLIYRRPACFPHF